MGGPRSGSIKIGGAVVVVAGTLLAWFMSFLWCLDLSVWWMQREGIDSMWKWGSGGIVLGSLYGALWAGLASRL
jgi:hypothetical protein